ncbi:GNAT family N-acetyltransferase [Glaciecola sp. KUL10]|uniref:GNAT family N-acetyltransferase n=1 Tax=Glaciecola sp. (strain KUL10) TaxID=2161813 RepID=UPI000D78867F|nr:GNAT family N-acetyltransferase [Glaciecola sp. KUL10]GBL04610.1 flagellar modification protein [Glaciecola sp. KUL10]
MLNYDFSASLNSLLTDTDFIYTAMTNGAININKGMTKRLNRLSGYGIELRPIEESDLEQLLEWRNRHDIRIMMKNQGLISFDSHVAWFKALGTKSTQQHFAIDYKSTLIGSANVSLIESTSDSTQMQFEPGLYIGHEGYKGNIVAFAPSLVLNDYCFDYLGAKRLVATVLLQNKAAIAYNTKLGYQAMSEQCTEGEKEWLIMGLQKQEYQHATKMIRGFLSR